MADEASKTEEVIAKESPVGGIGKYFRRIPRDLILSPGGIVLLFLAVIIEISDVLIPVSGIDSLVIELIPELVFAFMLKAIAGIPISGQLIPLVIERIPIISDIVPTFLGFFL